MLLVPLLGLGHGLAPWVCERAIGLMQCMRAYDCPLAQVPWEVFATRDWSPVVGW